MPNAKTVSLFTHLTESAQTLDGVWRIAAAHAGQGFESGYADPMFDDSLWAEVHLPHLRHSTVAQDTLWYRHHFTAAAPPAGKRMILRLGGAFYHTRGLAQWRCPGPARRLFPTLWL